MDRISVAYFRSLLHRYYTPYYYYPKDVPDPQSEQHLVSLHTNKDNLTIKRVIVDRPTDEIRGKKKNGAEKVRPHETLCTVESEDGRVFKIRAGVGGRVIEVNERLRDEPNLIKDPGEGYICILLTQLNRIKDELKPLEPANPSIAYPSISHSL